MGRLGPSRPRPDRTYPTATARLLTRADLDALPDERLRQEPIDGQFVTTPVAGTNHQTVSASPVSFLRDAMRGGELKALAASYDVVLGSHVVEPDLLVARKADFTARGLPVAPLLVVEIRSPSTANLDHRRKRDIDAEHGVLHYRMIDPHTPRITTCELIAGADADSVLRGDSRW